MCGVRVFKVEVLLLCVRYLLSIWLSAIDMVIYYRYGYLLSILLSAIDIFYR